MLRVCSACVLCVGLSRVAVKIHPSVSIRVWVNTMWPRLRNLLLSSSAGPVLYVYLYTSSSSRGGGGGVHKSRIARTRFMQMSAAPRRADRKRKYSFRISTRPRSNCQLLYLPTYLLRIRVSLVDFARFRAFHDSTSKSQSSLPFNIENFITGAAVGIQFSNT